MKHEIRHLFEGIGRNTEGNLIQAAISYLRASQETGEVFERANKNVKEVESERLVVFARERELFQDHFISDNYIGEGAEQKVYLANDGKSVYKTNDAIFYLSWEDYFVSLLIHNYLFPQTAYKLMGFHLDGKALYAVVKQRFVQANEITDLTLLKIFLKQNGFENTKNNDYFNDQLGIILEDLHDEDVLTKEGVFFFIDTVFYLKQVKPPAK